MSDLIKREDTIKELADYMYDVALLKADGRLNTTKHYLKLAEATLKHIPSADRPQGEWIEVSTLREIFGDVRHAHRGNSEAEAVLADVWDEVKDALKGADDD